MRKRVPEAGKSQSVAAPSVRNPTVNTKLLDHNIYPEDLGQSPTSSLISASPHEP